MYVHVSMFKFTYLFRIKMCTSVPKASKQELLLAICSFRENWALVRESRLEGVLKQIGPSLNHCLGQHSSLNLSSKAGLTWYIHQETATTYTQIHLKYHAPQDNMRPFLGVVRNGAVKENARNHISEHRLRGLGLVGKAKDCTLVRNKYHM